MGYGFGIFGIGMILMLLFWVLVIGGAVWLIVTLVRGSQAQSATRSLLSTAPPAQTPLDILKVRYARGEITKDQFDAMRRDLGI
ncbi:MAG: SHOCT domain-containing protein [Rudaea sp.]